MPYPSKINNESGRDTMVCRLRQNGSRYSTPKMSPHPKSQINARKESWHPPLSPSPSNTSTSYHSFILGCSHIANCSGLNGSRGGGGCTWKIVPKWCMMRFKLSSRSLSPPSTKIENHQGQNQSFGVIRRTMGKTIFDSELFRVFRYRCPYQQLAFARRYTLHDAHHLERTYRAGSRGILS